MQVLNRPWGAMHYRIDGPQDGPAVVFANSLGTDLRLWDALLAQMPGIRAIRFDKRGHGLSDEGEEYSIADLAEDCAALIEATASGPVVLVGLSIGGMIAQALAAARPELLRALVLSNTAAKMGTAESWAERIEAVETRGIAAIADTIMERWFAPKFRATPELALWRNMVLRSSPTGYVAACRALAATDLTRTTATITRPTLVVAGDTDGSSPAELVEATARLIPGADFRIIPEAGHLPCVEQPEAYVRTIAPFLQEHAR
ncbi:3-oxoadipate enol-lactonase [Paracoccus halophilus]|nr:3-oxoadipate enol-lactonase [Paracoccus halophilus]KGJ06256.1 3-oxoadipate enol-lactonase [Paracoccus halophilus]